MSIFIRISGENAKGQWRQRRRKFLKFSCFWWLEGWEGIWETMEFELRGGIYSKPLPLYRSGTSPEYSRYHDLNQMESLKRRSEGELGSTISQTLPPRNSVCSWSSLLSSHHYLILLYQDRWYHGWTLKSISLSQAWANVYLDRDLELRRETGLEEEEEGLEGSNKWWRWPPSCVPIHFLVFHLTGTACSSCNWRSSLWMLRYSFPDLPSAI